MNDKDNGKGVRGVIKKAVQAGAAYGVLAGGAYGAYHLVSPQIANSQEPAMQEPAKGRIAWSANPKYAAQTKFLRIIHAAWDDGNARLKMMRKAVDETYAVGRADLSTMFGGTLTEKIGSVELAESGAVVLTLTYTPGKDLPESKYSSVRIRYLVGTREPTDHDRLAAELEGREAVGVIDVKVLSKEGFDGATKTWAALEVPADSQPTMKAAPADDDEDDGNCAYPRWNPRGVKYGFISRDGLSAWYS